MSTGVQDLRGGDRRLWESFFQKLSGAQLGFETAPQDFSREGTPAILFLPTLFLSPGAETHVPRAPKAATHPSTQLRLPPLSEGSGSIPRLLGRRF